MTDKSIASSASSLQGLTRAAADSVRASRINQIIQTALQDIALVLYGRDRRANADRVELADIRRLGGEDLVRSYTTEAAMVLRQRDPDLHRAAAYYAANAATHGGVGSLSLSERRATVELFEVGLRAYREALANTAPPDVVARLGRLREADDQAGDLAQMVAPAGVQ